jgi:hypothetical protein
MPIALLIAFLFQAPSFAAKRYLGNLSCVSNNKNWTVDISFDKGRPVASVFKREDRVFASYPDIQTSSRTRIFGVDQYDITLKGTQYIILDHNLKNNQITGSFLISKNPFKPETLMTCTER